MQQQRYYSLDVFRGATVALMILVNNPGSWASIFPPLEHAKWNGCTPTDLVFPFFLFAVGNAMAFVMPKFEQKGSKYFLIKVIKRSILIFGIGLLLNWSPFVQWSGNELVFKPWSYIHTNANGTSYEDGVRLLGVLQRIAICYLIASLIVYYFKPKGAMVAAIIILFAYWLISLLAGNSADPFSITGHFARNIDIAVLTKYHMLHIDKIDGKVFHFDYEGLASTTAAIAQVIMGYLIGYYIQQKGKTYEMLSNLLVAAILFMAAGYCWDMVFPINKKIWSSSYTIYTTGLAIATIGVLIYLLEFKNAKGAWSKFFDVFGKNPLFIFVLSGFLPRLLTLFRINDHTDENGNSVYLSAFGWFYEHICKNISTDLRVGSLVYAISMIVMYWFIVYLLDKKKIYIKV
ncbi:MAG TPA: heparan-alpha-glucosaminide N-acetyltransferase domain-containing protein [Chitinophagaceae bacterium]|nr:heparan-alpha-glucosaminide N-acetyltransferase domain-containing protein [Chitinophagaceae bacterium]